MKTVLMKYRKKAPKKYFRLRLAIPNPAVHKGGIRAVAIATPGRMFPLSLEAMATIPAAPPNRAIRTS